MGSLLGRLVQLLGRPILILGLSLNLSAFTKCCMTPWSPSWRSRSPHPYQPWTALSGTRPRRGSRRHLHRRHLSAMCTRAGAPEEGLSQRTRGGSYCRGGGCCGRSCCCCPCTAATQSGNSIPSEADKDPKWPPADSPYQQAKKEASISTKRSPTPQPPNCWAGCEKA